MWLELEPPHRRKDVAGSLVSQDSLQGTGLRGMGLHLSMGMASEEVATVEPGAPGV